MSGIPLVSCEGEDIFGTTMIEDKSIEYDLLILESSNNGEMLYNISVSQEISKINQTLISTNEIVSTPLFNGDSLNNEMDLAGRNRYEYQYNITNSSNIPIDLTNAKLPKWYSEGGWHHNNLQNYSAITLNIFEISYLLDKDDKGNDPLIDEFIFNRFLSLTLDVVGIGDYRVDAKEMIATGSKSVIIGCS